MIHQRNKLAGRQRQRRIRGRGNMSVLISAHPLYAWFVCGKRLEDLYRMRCTRRVVSNAQFPMWIELIPNALYSFPKYPFGGLVHGHDDGDERLMFERLDMF